MAPLTVDTLALLAAMGFMVGVTVLWAGSRAFWSRSSSSTHE